MGRTKTNERGQGKINMSQRVDYPIHCNRHLSIINTALPVDRVWAWKTMALDSKGKRFNQGGLRPLKGTRADEK